MSDQPPAPAEDGTPDDDSAFRDAMEFDGLARSRGYVPNGEVVRALQAYGRSDAERNRLSGMLRAMARKVGHERRYRIAAMREWNSLRAESDEAVSTYNRTTAEILAERDSACRALDEAKAEAAELRAAVHAESSAKADAFVTADTWKLRHDALEAQLARLRRDGCYPAPSVASAATFSTPRTPAPDEATPVGVDFEGEERPADCGFCTIQGQWFHINDACREHRDM